MQIRVADATEEDFDLHVALRRVPSRDYRRGQRRRRTGSGVSLGFVSSWMHGETSRPRLNIASQCHAAPDIVRAVFATTHDILLEGCLFERRGLI